MGIRKHTRKAIEYLQANIDLFDKDKLSKEHNILLYNMERKLRELKIIISTKK